MPQGRDEAGGAGSRCGDLQERPLPRGDRDLPQDVDLAAFRNLPDTPGLSEDCVGSVMLQGVVPHRDIAWVVAFFAVVPSEEWKAIRVITSWIFSSRT